MFPTLSLLRSPLFLSLKNVSNVVSILKTAVAHSLFYPFEVCGICLNNSSDFVLLVAGEGWWGRKKVTERSSADDRCSRKVDGEHKDKRARTMLSERKAELTAGLV